MWNEELFMTNKERRKLTRAIKAEVDKAEQYILLMQIARDKKENSRPVSKRELEISKEILKECFSQYIEAIDEELNANT